MVVKIGGAALEDSATLRKCAQAVAELARDGHLVAVVHGGGSTLTRTLKQMGRESGFIDGLRITDAETRDVALMVLAGMVNKKLVAAIQAAGFTAIGLCGGDGSGFRARKKDRDSGKLGFVGEICATEPRWLEAIWREGAVPVLSSIALGFDGEYYNINADQMAASCATACGANLLIFLTDVPGVKDAAGAVMRWLRVAEVSGLVAQSVIQGGMLPKLAACAEALRNGVGRVRILPAVQADVLPLIQSMKLEFGTEVLRA
jgi:acetylglutamate kinase